MKVYNITPKAFANLTGEGSSKSPGRWNTKGTRCLYTSASPSLAQLEMMVNMDDWSKFNKMQYVLLTLKVDTARLKRLEIKDLPPEWNSHDCKDEVQAFAMKQIENCGCIGLIVPSVVIPQESNIVLYPDASRFEESVEIIQEDSFQLDKRLLKHCEATEG